MPVNHNEWPCLRASTRISWKPRTCFPYNDEKEHSIYTLLSRYTVHVSTDPVVSWPATSIDSRSSRSCTLDTCHQIAPSKGLQTRLITNESSKEMPWTWIWSDNLKGNPQSKNQNWLSCKKIQDHKCIATLDGDAEHDIFDDYYISQENNRNEKTTNWSPDLPLPTMARESLGHESK